MQTVSSLNDNLSVSGNAEDVFSADRRSPLFSANLCARLRHLRSPNQPAKFPFNESLLISAGTKNRPCLTTKPTKTQTQNKTRQNYYANMPFQDFFLHTLSGGELKRLPAYSHTPEIQANCIHNNGKCPL